MLHGRVSFIKITILWPWLASRPAHVIGLPRGQQSAQRVFRCKPNECNNSCVKSTMLLSFFCSITLIFIIHYMSFGALVWVMLLLLRMRRKTFFCFTVGNGLTHRLSFQVFSLWMQIHKPSAWMDHLIFIESTAEWINNYILHKCRVKIQLQMFAEISD